MKLASRERKRPKDSARNMSEIRTLREHLLKVKDFKLYWKNDTKLSGDERKDEGLYKEIKEWKLESGS